MAYPNQLVIHFILFLLANRLLAQESNCNNPLTINLPFSIQGVSTCNAGNDITTSPCSNVLFLASEDVFFAYTSEGQECISVSLTQTTEGTGIGIYFGCPDTATLCLSQAGGIPGVTDLQISSVFLPWAGTYYLIVDNAVACTTFDLQVTNVDCPVIYPPSAMCEQAISLNGCAGVVPDIHIAAGEGDPSFIQSGLNDGCWDGTFPYNYTWFTFRAAASGQFAFTLFASDPLEATDLDFQIWGPAGSADSLCTLAANTQPVRSSFAAGKEPTGLAALHPVLNIPVTDTCEGAGGDDFLTPLQVHPGEWYLILVNDWGGGLASGAVSVDFSESDAQVLGEATQEPRTTQDTLICPGDSLVLWASGGLFYQWIANDDLSCIYCPQALASPSVPQTYSVVIHSLCSTDTLSTEVAFHPMPSVVSGPDTTLCGLKPVMLYALANVPGNFIWLPDSIAGSEYYPPQMLGTHHFVTFFEDEAGCYQVSDTVTVHWHTGIVAEELLYLPNDTVFVGANLVIKPDTVVPGLTYVWEDPFFSSSDSLLIVAEVEGDYEVGLTVMDTSGCSTQLKGHYVVLPIRIDVPNAFSPNSDEYNQTFGPVIHGEGITPVSLKIWNRWGQIVHSSTGTMSWDGNHNGQPAPADLYVYRMEFLLPKGQRVVKTGEVHLLR